MTDRKSDAKVLNPGKTKPAPAERDPKYADAGSTDVDPTRSSER